jgi:hypothetical protein
MIQTTYGNLDAADKLAKHLVAKLDELGSWPPDIYKSLKERGIKGVKNSPCNCPIAVYLRPFTDPLPVEVHETFFRVGGLTGFGTFIKKFLPFGFTEFIRNLDDGLYPELETAE